MSDKSEIFTTSARLLVAAMETKAVGGFDADDNDANIAKIGKLYEAVVQSVHATWLRIK